MNCILGYECAVESLVLEAYQCSGSARRKGDFLRWNRKADETEVPQAGHIAWVCYNPCLDKLLLLDEKLCIFIYQMLQAEVMENEGEFLALGWSICVGLCNRDAELRIVTELAWSWPETSFKSTWSLARKEYLWEQLQFGTSCSVFVSTDAKLEEHHVIPMGNAQPLTFQEQQQLLVA